MTRRGARIEHRGIIGKCTDCGRSVFFGQPYEPTGGEYSTRDGIRHLTCPPDLYVVQP